MRRRVFAMVVGIAIVGAAGCADDSSDAPVQEAYSQECGDAMSRAAAVDEMRDTIEDLHPAMIACSSLAEFAAASADHPDALDGADPATFARNACRGAGDPQVSNSSLCQEVSGG